MKVLNERFPYRYVECGTLENGFPDFRIQKADVDDSRLVVQRDASAFPAVIDGDLVSVDGFDNTVK